MRREIDSSLKSRTPSEKENLARKNRFAMQKSVVLICRTQKRNEPERALRLARRINVRKNSKKSAQSKNLLKVVQTKSSLQPVAASDQTEVIYRVETKTEIVQRIYLKHSFVPRRKTDKTPAAPSNKLVSITFENKGRASAQIVSRL